MSTIETEKIDEFNFSVSVDGTEIGRGFPDHNAAYLHYKEWLKNHGYHEAVS